MDICDVLLVSRDNENDHESQARHANDRTQSALPVTRSTHVIRKCWKDVAYIRVRRGLYSVLNGVGSPRYGSNLR